MATRMSLDSSKSSKPCRKLTSYSAYEAFMRSSEVGHVKPKTPSNKNISTFCGDGTWTWDTDQHETGKAFDDDDEEQSEPFSSHDITYIGPPISREEIEMQEATSLSDIQPPSQISAPHYDDDFDYGIPQDKPVYTREAEDELFLKNFNPLSAQKKTTKTIFSVVQSMDNRDPFLPKTKDQRQQVPSRETRLQSQERKERNKLPKKEEIPTVPIPTSKGPVQTNAPGDSLIFYQSDFPTSNTFATTIYLENPSSNLIGYKVSCNYKAAVLFSVTPTTGIISPRSQVGLLVKTKRTNEIVPSEFSELMIDTKFMVKMFPLKDDNERRLPQCFNMLSKERPELIFTQVIDKVILHFPNNLDGRKSALDIIESNSKKLHSKDSISGWGSLENLENSGVPNQAEVMLANQNMRLCLSLIADMRIFLERMSWFVITSFPLMPLPLLLIAHLLINYLFPSY